MDFLPFQFGTFLAGSFLTLLGFVLLLNIFGLPANWIILGLDAVWKYAHPGNQELGWIFWSIMILLALTGEGMELALQIVKARRYGSTSSGAWGGMIGSIIGAIALAPLFWGIGAFIGALAGAWLGCFLMEIMKGKSSSDACHAAYGTTLGRFLGTISKIGIGAMMIAITGRHILPATKTGEEEIICTLLQLAGNQS